MHIFLNALDFHNLDHAFYWTVAEQLHWSKKLQGFYVPDFVRILYGEELSHFKKD